MLREVVAAVMDLVVCAREETTQSVGKEMMASGTSGSGGGSEHGLFSGAGTEKGMVSIRESENAEGNDSMLRLVRHVCEVYGVDLDAVKVLSGELGTVGKKGKGKAKENGDGDGEEMDPAEAEALDDGKRHLYGWPELQVGAVREAVAVAEALPGPYRRDANVS